MKKFAAAFFLFCSTFIIMSGCRKNHTPPSLSRVVTKVDIFCQSEGARIERHYTDMRKMEYVLLYLRLLKPLGKPDLDPELLDKDVYEITVHLSDGSRKRYRQKAHKYFSRDERPWEMIHPGQAAGLYELIRYLPSDTVMVYVL